MSKRLSSNSRSRGNFAAIRLHIEYVALQRLVVRRRQLRTYRKAMLAKLAGSIDRSGFIVPIIVDDQLAIVCGYARFEAAKLSGLEEVPVVRVSHLTDEQLRLYAAFDNKIAEEGEWDEEALVLEFGELQLISADLDLGDSGFEIAEIDRMAGRARTAELSDLDSVVEPSGDHQPVTRHGDLWLCGRHRVLCGDSTDRASIEKFDEGAKIRQLLSDAPYNLPTAAFSKSKKHGDFAMGAGEMSPAAFTDFLASFIRAAQPSLMDGAFIYAFMDWRHIRELIDAGEQCGLTYAQLLVWNKAQAGLGSFYRNGFELAAVFRHGEAKGRNNIMLGAHGRNRSNVLNYPGVRGKSGGGARALKMHPSVKNIAMIADLMLDASAPGEAILDSFGGSGTTLIAAEKVDRVAYLCELSPAYVDVTVERFNALGGEQARLAATGQTFAEVSAERLATKGAAQ